MPVTVNGAGLDQWIAGIKGRFESPELIQQLGQSLADDLGLAFMASGLTSRSGAGFKAITTVNEPEKTANGWKIGVGDRKALGDENQTAPRGTLRAFFEDNPTIRPSPWRGIPQSYKEKLEAMRRAGMYGGRGPDYANYMWVQNRGSGEAHIAGRHFIETGLNRWRGRVPDIINQWWQGLGRIGRAKETIRGIFRR